jgi:hypothetical protein
LILIVSIADVKDLLETHAASFQKGNRKMEILHLCSP